MLKMVDGTGIIGVDMICPLGVSTPQPPNYDKVEVEGVGSLMLPNSLEAPVERVELIGNSVQPTTTGKNLFDIKKASDVSNYITTETLAKIDITAAIVFDVKKNTNYCLSVSGKTDQPSINFNIANDVQRKSIFNKLKTEETLNSLDSGKIYVGFSGGDTELNATKLSQEYFDIQLEEASSKTPYEPYTGGNPSPSPEYPQEIKNSGKWNEETQKYEVDVKITGKNLFDIEKAKDTSNWIIRDVDGYAKFPIYVKKGSRITFSYTEKLPTGIRFHLGISQSETTSIVSWLYHDTITSLINNKCTIVAENDYAYLSCIKSCIQKFLDTIQTLQVEISPTQTNYEPYKEQTLTLTSDRPITKWDRLVEQGGEIGWLYKHKIIEDFSTLVKDTEPIYGNDGGKYFSVSLQNASLNYDRSKIYSEVGIYGKDNKKYYIPQPLVASTIINVSDTDTIMTAKEHMHYKVVYETVDSEFIPLSQDQQDAIRALKTYYPTTVITADGGELDPDIKVTYRKEI